MGEILLQRHIMRISGDAVGAMMTLSIERGHENSESSFIFVFHYLFITFHNFYLHIITTTSTQAP
jgi:hypothetical protein